MDCRKQAAQLRRRLSEIRALGAELVAVGNGNVTHLRWFIEDQKPEYPVYTDPGRATYALAGMKRGLRIAAPGSVLNAARMYAEGIGRVGVKGDALQLGGTLIIAPGDRLIWSDISERLGEHAGEETLMAQLREAVAA